MLPTSSPQPSWAQERLARLTRGAGRTNCPEPRWAGPKRQLGICRSRPRRRVRSRMSDGKRKRNPSSLSQLRAREVLQVD